MSGTSSPAIQPIINLDQLEALPISALKPNAPERYQGSSLAPISPRIGARLLGYNLTVVPPGKSAFPAHNHYANEEMFFILEGIGELRLGEARFGLRAGDVVACPPGDGNTAHQISNTAQIGDLRFLAVSTAITPDLVQYPDSGKTGASFLAGRDAQGLPIAVRVLNRERDNLDYWDGE